MGQTAPEPDLLLREQIRFDYLPENPLSRGWSKAPYTNIEMDSNPEFSALIVGPEVRLNMRVKNVFAMDHEIARNAQFSNRLAYSAIYHKTTMLMLGFSLRSADGSFSDRWIKIELGRGPEPEVNPGWPNEYLIWLTGEDEPGGWMRFNLLLPDLVARTWQRHGYKLGAFTRIRLRGSLCISPISLYS